MKRNRRKRRSNFEKIILAILIIILIGLLIYAFKDKFTSDNTTSTNTNNNTNKVQPSKNKTKIEDKKDDDKKETTTNSEPKKNEKEEVKQELQNNVTYSIELVGNEEITLKVGDKYNELGAKAKDSNGNDVSSKINIDNSVDTSKPGEYMVVYSIGKSMVIRTVIVK